MNKKKGMCIVSLLLSLSVLLTACYTTNSMPENTVTNETAKIPSVVSLPTPTSTPTLTPQVKPMPPIDISEVSFRLENLKDYLVFDKDGLQMPQINELYQTEMTEYNDTQQDYPAPNFYLLVAEYDIDNNRKKDYIVKRPSPDRIGGMKFDEAYFDIICTQEDDTLKKISSENHFLLNNENPIAILSTATNGFYDILVNTENSTNSVHEFNGIVYERRYLEDDSSVVYDKFGSSGPTNYTVKDNVITLNYVLRGFINRSDKDYQFFIAGLFSTAKQDGIVENERLWACDEHGNIKLFSTTEDFYWGDILFTDNYAGGDLSPYTDSMELIWPDEIRLVLCEP